MENKKLTFGILLVFLAGGVYAVEDAESPNAYRGWGALFTQGKGFLYSHIRWGASVMDVEDTIIVVVDDSNGRTKVWNDGGELMKYGSIWVFEGTGRLHTRGMSYHIIGDGTFDRYLTYGAGGIRFDGSFESIAIGWRGISDVKVLEASMNDLPSIARDIVADGKVSEAEIDALTEFSTGKSVKSVPSSVAAAGNADKAKPFLKKAWGNRKQVNTGTFGRGILIRGWGGLLGGIRWGMWMG